ncbi:Hypothetical protein MVR_LOCUS22 [uncultured virus]|nr:Hypothetical protein MVR_LOCUS22 [uncultured virus]
MQRFGKGLWYVVMIDAAIPVCLNELGRLWYCHDVVAIDAQLVRSQHVLAHRWSQDHLSHVLASLAK